MAAGNTAWWTIHEDRLVKTTVTPDWRFKGYQDLVAQGLVLRANVVRPRREVWVAPGRGRITAPLLPIVIGHFGLELRCE